MSHCEFFISQVWFPIKCTSCFTQSQYVHYLHLCDCSKCATAPCGVTKLNKFQLLHQDVKKRLRENEDEDKPDCIPLSKRINNLHIDAGTSYNGLSLMPLCKHSCSSQVDSFAQMKPQLSPYNECPSELNPVNNCNGTSRPNESAVQPYTYSPELSRSDNPHYYEPNRLLFNLYVERLQRSNTHPY